MAFTPERVDNCDELEAYNATELYQLCKRAGINVVPTMNKGELLDTIRGALEIHDHNPIDDIRYGIMAYLLERWARASSQLFCPAKSGDPDSCKQCEDAQVIHCLTTNKGIEPGVMHHIARRKKT